MRTLLAICFGVLLTAAPGAQGQVWTVDDNGGAAVDFPAIQPAIDAASDGDVVFVRTGVYAPFVIDGKGVIVTAAGDGVVGVTTGVIAIRNLPAGRTAGVRGVTAALFSAIRFDLVNNQGSVWLEDCRALDSEARRVSGTVTSSVSATLVGCDFRPGGGLPSPVFDGLSVTDSVVRVYRGSYTGLSGTQGFAGTPGQDGFAGIRATGSVLHSSGTEIRGGSGGAYLDLFLGGCAAPGDGGPAVHLIGPGAKLLHQDTDLIPGAMGTPDSFCGPMGAQDGVPILIEGGGAQTALAGTARLLTAGSPVFVGGTLALDLAGEMGEHVFAAVSTGVGGFYLPSLSGSLMTAPPWVVVFLGVLPPGGSLHLSVPINGIGPGLEGLPLVIQGAFVHPSTLGPDYLGSPTLVLALEPQPPFGPTTYHVDDDAPGDPGPGDPTVGDPLEDGSLAHPFDSVQEALDAATHGDTVLLADGRYRGAGNKELDFGGKSVDLVGSGAAGCVVDCEGSGRAIHVTQYAPESFRIEGITFRGAAASDGGGAIRLEVSACEIVACVFEANAPGAIYTGYGTHLSIAGCTFLGNTSGGGGAITFVGELTMTDSLFSGNVVSGLGYGGALYQLNPSYPCDIRRCSFVGNSAYRGGAAHVRWGILEGLLVLQNTAGYAGGGIFLEGQNVTLRDCLVAQNHAERGGGICASNTASILSSTIAHNTASTEGGGLVLAGTVRDTVVWGNTAPAGSQMWGWVDVAYCDVQGGPVAPWIEGGSVTWGVGNLTVDPMFVLPAGLDYHLDAASPCIDAGDPLYVVAPGELDFDGEPRVQGAAIDVGADERP